MVAAIIAAKLISNIRWNSVDTNFSKKLKRLHQIYTNQEISSRELKKWKNEQFFPHYSSKLPFFYVF